MSLPQAENHESNIFVRRVHRLKFFEGVDGLGVLLVQVVGVGDFELRIGELRAERIFGLELRQNIDGTQVALFGEVLRALVI